MGHFLSVMDPAPLKNYLYAHIPLSIRSSMVTSPPPTPVTSSEKARSPHETRNPSGTKTAKFSTTPPPRPSSGPSSAARVATNSNGAARHRRSERIARRVGAGAPIKSTSATLARPLAKSSASSGPSSARPRTRSPTPSTSSASSR